MKINMPVTDVEHPFPKDRLIVSQTDLKGITTYANDTFIEISGFNQDELIGHNHNLVRHPDMPPEAFADLWTTIKSGKLWRGIVKNRRKNGDYYWVEALVVPVFKHNQTVGYMSVRKAPSREQVKSAEALYREIREGRAKLKSGSPLDFLYLVPFNTRYAALMGIFSLTPFAAVLAALQGMTSLAYSIAGSSVVLAAASLFFTRHHVTRPLAQANAVFNQIAQGSLDNDISIDGRDEAERILVSLAYMQAHLVVIIDEILLAAETIRQRCSGLEDNVRQVVTHSTEQQDHVMQVSAAMEEVSASITEVAKNAEGTAQAAKASLSVVQTGNSQMDESIRSASRVVESVRESSETITRLNHAIQKIGTVTQVIKDIADQTNLLALNAAIEAARAGEQGRGFAVVADEVRKLAERTTHSTADIAHTIEEIQQTTSSAVSSMDRAAGEVNRGRNLLQDNSENFKEITAACVRVTEMSEHIANAAGEQSIASDDVAKNMAHMSQLIDENTASIQHMEQSMQALTAIAEKLGKLVAHFDGN